MTSQFIGEILYADANPRPKDLTPTDQLLTDGFGKVDGDRKANALPWLNDHGIDSDNLSSNITESATTVARIDGRIGLNEILIGSCSKA